MNDADINFYNLPTKRDGGMLIGGLFLREFVPGGYMDPISFKYTHAPFPSRGPDRVCFVIAVEKAVQRIFSFVHNPGC